MKPVVITKSINGLKVTVAVNKYVESAFASLRVLAGSAYEKPNTLGCAHLLEHALLHNAQKIVPLRICGTKIIGVTSRDDVLFALHTLKNGIGQGLDFLATITNRIELSDQYIRPISNNIRAEMERQSDKPEKLLLRTLLGQLYPKTRMAFPNLGTINCIEDVKLEHLVTFKNKFYSPKSSTLVIVGNVNPDYIFKKVEKSFYKYNGNNLDSHLDIKFTSNKNTELKYISNTHFQQSYIGAICEACKYTENYYYANLVASYYIKQVLNNKLKNNFNLYKIDFSLFSGLNYGYFNFYCCTGADKAHEIANSYQELIKAIPSIIDRKLLMESKQAVFTNILFSLEKLSMLSEYISMQNLSNQDILTPAQLVKTIKQIPNQQIENILNEISKKAHQIVVISNQNR